MGLLQLMNSALDWIKSLNYPIIQSKDSLLIAIIKKLE